jgi:hypothetical protein
MGREDDWGDEMNEYGWVNTSSKNVHESDVGRSLADHIRRTTRSVCTNTNESCGKRHYLPASVTKLNVPKPWPASRSGLSEKDDSQDTTTTRTEC